MRVRLSNGFLLFMGIIFGVLNFFTPNLILSFLFGTCFGLIYLNHKLDKL